MQFAPGGEALHKPKGIWIEGNRLWVTDIDVVWVFDLTNRRGKKLALPGANNDLTDYARALSMIEARPADRRGRAFEDLRRRLQTALADDTREGSR